MNKPIEVKFWGVRGSIPVPGPSTVRYGGNTSCVSVLLGEDKVLVLDAGTGIKDLGKYLSGKDADIFVLVTHAHWDHIQGFPFFAPIYQKDREICIFPYSYGRPLFSTLIDQMDGAHFPVSMDDLPSRHRIITDDPGLFMRSHGFDITRIAVNHPGGAFGYRVENGGRSVVYITDNELDPVSGDKRYFGDFVRFCRKADILIHDAQYTENDMPQKQGWGHSQVNHVCRLAAESGAGHLLLYHHDPDRDDLQIDEIQDQARAWFRNQGLPTRCTAAFEGLVLEI